MARREAARRGYVRRDGVDGLGLLWLAEQWHGGHGVLWHRVDRPGKAMQGMAGAARQVVKWDRMAWRAMAGEAVHGLHWPGCAGMALVGHGGRGKSRTGLVGSRWQGEHRQARNGETGIVLAGTGEERIGRAGMAVRASSDRAWSGNSGRGWARNGVAGLDRRGTARLAANKHWQRGRGMDGPRMARSAGASQALVRLGEARKRGSAGLPRKRRAWESGRTRFFLGIAFARNEWDRPGNSK